MYGYQDIIFLYWNNI